VKNILILLLFISFYSRATDPYKRNPAIDILHYTFQLEVNDSTDVIAGKASVSIKFKKPTTEFELDLIGKDKSAKGMSVSAIMLDGKKLTFNHSSDRIKITLPNPAKENEALNFEINYSGIPQDGLIIGKNKFNDRGFFGDNWPNRGHHWLPVVDHPSDKATVDFIVIAPMHYSVVANGIKVEESFLDANRKLTHWHEEVPIGVKVMVVGVLRASQFSM
jgi:aminopeptidase N